VSVTIFRCALAPTCSLSSLILLPITDRAAQIRAGIWKRNGPAMSDQVLNYSEPPFCRHLADDDMLLLQFTLICHTSQNAGTPKKSGAIDQSALGLTFFGQGTSRLVVRFAMFVFFRGNRARSQLTTYTAVRCSISEPADSSFRRLWLVLCLCDFIDKKVPKITSQRSFIVIYSIDFLGFDKAPNKRIAKYREEINSGLYPSEIQSNQKTDEESSAELVLPWTYCPAPDDPATCLSLVDELMHLIIILITVRRKPR
jgi:hypothetical protein